MSSDQDHSRPTISFNKRELRRIDAELETAADQIRKAQAALGAGELGGIAVLGFARSACARNIAMCKTHREHIAEAIGGKRPIIVVGAGAQEFLYSLSSS